MPRHGVGDYYGYYAFHYVYTLMLIIAFVCCRFSCRFICLRPAGKHAHFICCFFRLGHAATLRFAAISVIAYTT